MKSLDRYLDEELRKALARLKADIPYTAPEAADERWIESSIAAAQDAVRRWILTELDRAADYAPGEFLRVELNRDPVLWDADVTRAQPALAIVADPTVPNPSLATQVQAMIENELRCSACGLIQPARALHEFHPDGAPDVIDYVCIEVTACSERVWRARQGRHSR